MKVCFLLLIIFFFFTNNLEIKNQQVNPETIYDDIINKISKELNNYLDEIEKQTNKQKTKDCINKMKKYFSDSSKYKYSYLTKLFFDSSPNYEDIKNYYNCYNNLYSNVNRTILNNLTYIVIKYRDLSGSKVTEYEYAFNSFSKVFGACVPKGCDHEAYFDIINFINNNNFLIEGNIIDVIDLNPTKEYSLAEIIFQLLLPILMILFILSLICIKYISGIFWSLFGCFFMICHKKKYDKEEIEKFLKLNKRSQIDAINSFINISSNIEEVMPGSKDSQITNEDGLQIAVGLRSIFIIGLFLGLTIQNIFITPTRIFDDEVYRQYMKSNLYAFLFFFARISQKMLYSISGFELTFKLLFYFDNQLYKKNVPSVQNVDLNTMNLNKFVEDSSSNTNSVIYSSSSKANLKSQNNLENLVKNIATSPKSSKNQSKTISKKFRSKSINEDEEEESEDFDEESSEESEETEKKNRIYINKKKKSNISKSNELSKKFFASHEGEKIYLKNCNKLPFYTLLTFHLRQSYLYFIFIFSILYFIFCQTQFLAEYYQKGSYWMMITSELKDFFNTKIIFATIFLYAGTCSYLKNYYNFFIPAMNEIFFYLFGTTIIYICYKKNSRLDKYLMIIILIAIFAKILIYIIFSINFKEGEIETYYRPSLDFMQNWNYYLIQMHLLNLSYYCIGMIVGLANYSLQINSKKKKIVKEFVKLPRKLFFVIKRTYNFIFGLALFLIFLFCDIFLYKIHLSLNIKHKDDNPEYEVLYFKSIFINIFNLIDCEIVITCILILTIILFYSSYSFLRDNFNAYPWKILSRIYFPLLLTSYMQSNWFLFQFAERIDLNLEGVLYVLTLIFILSVVVSIFIYVFFQVPLKKITKLIYVENNKIIDELNSSISRSHTASMSIDDNEAESIDLNANNTKCFINGRNLSGDSKEDSGEDDGAIRTNYDFILENENNVFNNDN